MAKRLRRAWLVAAGVAFLGAAPVARAVTFSNPVAIKINDASAQEAPASATPYPSPITLSGVYGTVAQAAVTLHGFHHECPQDVDILLVGPTGARTLLMSDAGDCVGNYKPHQPIELTFLDGAPPVPCYEFSATTALLAAGTYSPTDDPQSPNRCRVDSDVFNPPVPAGPASLGLSPFGGKNPNGQWSLYVMDQYHNDDDGAIDGGWSLTLTIPAATLTTAPAIAGKPEAGKTLTAKSGTIGGGGTPSFAWSRCNTKGRRCSAIAGATSNKYAPVRADRGRTLVVTETALSAGGNSRSLSSKHTGVVGPALISSRTKTSQRVLAQGGVVASLTSNLRGTLTATGTVKVPGSAGVVRFRRVRKKLSAGKRTTVKLRPSAAGLQRIAHALAHGARLRAKLHLTVADTRGGKSTKTVAVRLS